MSANEQLEIDTVKQQAGGDIQPETLDGCRRFFYAFDHEHRGSLCLTDVKRAVAFAFLKDPAAPSDGKTRAVFDEIIQQRLLQPDPEEMDRVTLSEFLRLLFVLKSKQGSREQLA